MRCTSLRHVCRLLIVSLMFLSCHTARAGLIGAEQLTGAAPPAAHSSAQFSPVTRADPVSALQMRGVT